MNRFWQLALAVSVVNALVTAPVHAQSPAPDHPATTPQGKVPRLVPFNGQVVKAKGEARTGPVLLTFGLYEDEKGGTPLWTEQQTVALDREGRYSVIIGSVNADGLPGEAFAAGTPRWLGVQVESD